jgi:hypothetical protein
MRLLAVTMDTVLVMLGPSHNGMSHPRVANGENDLHKFRVAANISKFYPGHRTDSLERPRQ